jgi:hypothetical protein
VLERTRKLPGVIDIVDLLHWRTDDASRRWGRCSEDQESRAFPVTF